MQLVSTILKGDQLKIISVKFGQNPASSFRAENVLLKMLMLGGQ